MGTYAEIQTDIGRRVTVVRTVHANALIGQAGPLGKMIHPGEEFQLIAVHRSTLGGYTATIAEESYDPHLGKYTTPYSVKWTLPFDDIRVHGDHCLVR